MQVQDAHFERIGPERELKTDAEVRRRLHSRISCICLNTYCSIVEVNKWQ